MSNMISNISLCDVEITPTHQLDFDSISEQKSYFLNHTIKQYYPCKYQSRKGTIKVKGYVDTFNNVNYGYYTNEYNGTIKTYYFWIVEKIALARETTELIIQLDVFQTWLFDFKINRCFIEREHVNNDSIGYHTIAEDFELGDYTNINVEYIEEMTGNVCFLLGLTDSEQGAIGGVYGKSYSGVQYKYYSSSDYTSLSDEISDLCENGKGDCIAFIGQFPEKFFKKTFPGISSGAVLPYNNSVCSLLKTYEFKKNFIGVNTGSYTPRNNKLYTYPYMNITVTSPNGNNIVLKPELFYAMQMNRFLFYVQTVPKVNPTFSITPYDYNNFSIDGTSTIYDSSIQDSLECECFGLCSWNNDNFANWYAQHQNSIKAQSLNASANYRANTTVYDNSYKTGKENNSANFDTATATNLLGLGNILSNPLGTATGFASGELTAANNYNNTNRSLSTDLSNNKLLNRTDYNNTIRSLMASVSDAQVQPNTAKGDTSGSGLDVARDTATFFIMQKGIKPEHAKMIDDYFTMYGYKVNRLDVPNFKTRKVFIYSFLQINIIFFPRRRKNVS